MDDDLLTRKTYTDAQAAHLLTVPLSTLRWWLEGRAHHKPVLRENPTGDRNLTWGEFVEARYLVEYRRRNVTLQQIRAFTSRLRQEMNVLHPLATTRPWIGEGRRLLLEVQRAVELPLEESAVYEVTTGQLVLSPAAQAFLDVVEFDDEAEIISKLRPLGRTSPVVIDPDLRAGASSVRGISTAVLLELVDAGDAIETVAEDYGLALDDAVAALAYERSLARAA